MNTYSGFLPSYVRYGDHDAILHCFTREEGFYSFFAKGIYTAKNKKKAYLFPLNEIIITTSNAKSGKISNVSKIESAHNKDIYLDIKINAIIFFVADFLNQILKNEQAQQEIYNEISCFIHAIETTNVQAHIIILFNILKIQGWSPLVSSHDYLNPESGVFTINETHYLFNKENSDLWKLVLNQDNPYRIQLTRPQRQALLDTLLVYYHYHFVDFKTPKSLEVIQDIF
ncbi:DNA repair protein RecO [Chryseobacterium sp. T1]